MIVTSFPRSGSTFYCINLANELGYKFYDEIFEQGYHHKKDGVHEISLDIDYPKTPSYIKTIDFDKAVINNHEISFFTLQHTDIFLTRQNAQDAVWSYLAYSDKLISRYQPKIARNDILLKIILTQNLKRWLDRMIFFYDYIHEYNKPVDISKLEFSDSEIYRAKYSEFSSIIEEVGNGRLRLPQGVIFK